MIFMKFILAVVALLSSYLMMTIGWGLEVKSWTALILCLIVLVVVEIISKVIDD